MLARVQQRLRCVDLFLGLNQFIACDGARRFAAFSKRSNVL